MTPWYSDTLQAHALFSSFNMWYMTDIIDVEDVVAAEKDPMFYVISSMFYVISSGTAYEWESR